MKRETVVHRLLRLGLRFPVRAAALALLSILMAGIAYEVIGAQLDRRAHPPVGDLVPIGSHAMYFHSDGRGQPTLVFSQGLRSPSAYVDFYPLT